MAIQDNVNSAMSSVGSAFRTYGVYSAAEALQGLKSAHMNPKQEEIEKVKGTIVDETSIIPGASSTSGSNDTLDAEYRILSDQDELMALRAKKSLLKYNKAKQIGFNRKQLPGGNI